MSHIEAFFAEWKNNSKPHKSSMMKHIRMFNDVEVALSKSACTNTVRVNSLRSNDQRKGEATKFMKWLTRRADKQGFFVTLSAEPFGWNKDDAMDKDQLKEWMEKYGFSVKWEWPDEDGYEMIRKPSDAT